MTPEVNLLYQQACSAEYKEDYTTAVQKLTEALKLAGNDVMLYTKLAGVYSEMGEYDKALAAYAKVAELKPSDGYIYISVGSIYENQGKYKEALDAYNKVAQMCPEYLYNYLNIANVQYQLRNYKDAIENYNKFLATYSQHAEARENLANSYMNDGNYTSAANEYENLYVKNPAGFKDYANFGLALYRLKNYEKASTFLEKAVEADPDNITARISLALSYQELEKDDLALAQYDVIFKQAPQLHSLRLDYANLLADIGNNAAAIEQYKIYTEKFPDDVRGFKNLAILYERDKNYDLAIAEFAKAIEKDKDLYSETSPYQKVDVFSSRAFGNVLTLDGLMMVTERDEFFYHEMIVHIPMLTHKNPKNILVIGGGDGGTVRELLKHKSVEHIDMVEIDGLVVEASKKFFPTVSNELNNPKVNVLIQDAVEFIKDKEDIYDIVLIDSTDPIGPGEGLFNEKFYNNVKRALKKGGIVTPQTEGPFAQSENMKKTYHLLRKVFKNVAPYCGPMPTYPGGYWSWGFCSDDVEIPFDCTKIDEKRAQEIEKTCKIYNRMLHCAAFMVPNFVKELANG